MLFVARWCLKLLNTCFVLTTKCWKRNNIIPQKQRSFDKDMLLLILLCAFVFCTKFLIIYQATSQIQYNGFENASLIQDLNSFYVVFQSQIKRFLCTSKWIERYCELGVHYLWMWEVNCQGVHSFCRLELDCQTFVRKCVDPYMQSTLFFLRIYDNLSSRHHKMSKTISI